MLPAGHVQHEHPSAEDAQAPVVERGDQLAAFLNDSNDSPIRRFTSRGADIDSVIDFRAIFQSSHCELKVDELPALLLARKGCFGLVDYEKSLCADLRQGNDVFGLRGINREQGVVVVVRPDQYVSHVLPLDAYRDLSTFFERFMLDCPLS